MTFAKPNARPTGRAKVHRFDTPTLRRSEKRQFIRLVRRKVLWIDWWIEGRHEWAPAFMETSAGRRDG